MNHVVRLLGKPSSRSPGTTKRDLLKRAAIFKSCDKDQIEPTTPERQHQCIHPSSCHLAAKPCNVDQEQSTAPHVVDRNGWQAMLGRQAPA
jgi:hypothetical protein